MDINNLSVTDLKALAYDEMVKIQIAQQNLDTINQKLVQLTVQSKQELKAEDVQPEA